MFRSLNMGPYGFSLALGVTGLVVMAVLGFGHHVDTGGHGGHAGDGHVGHDHAGHDHAGHGPGGDHGSHGLGKLTHLLSPRILFSFLVGAGATGVLVSGPLFEPLTAAVAVAGGFLFERLLVGPLWRLLFRFESRPALTLESAVLEEAHAVTDFDAAGQGLISIELDGQIVQLLGTLVATESGMPRIRRGDLLRVEQVDPHRHQCTVSYAGQRPTGALP